jgi:hypothetical protein
MVRVARFGNLAHMRLAATPRSWLIVAACLCAVAAPSVATSQVYRYKDKDGAWVYTDQPPGAPESVESLAVSHGNAPPKITIVPRSADGRIEFVPDEQRSGFLAPGQTTGHSFERGRAFFTFFQVSVQVTFVVCR